MPFASTSLQQLRYMIEATPGVTQVSGNCSELRQTKIGLKASVATKTSEEMRADRLTTGLTPTDLNIDGGFDFELSGKEYDPFIEGLLDSVYTHFGTLGVGVPFSMATTATTVTASAATTGSSLFTLLPTGSWFKILAPVAASAAVKAYFATKWFKCAGTTSTVITLDASTPLTGVGLIGATTPGFYITASRVQNATGLNRHFTFEEAHADIGQYLSYRGCRTNSMDLSMDIGSTITGMFDFVGLGHDGMLPATTLPGTPIASNALEMINASADIGAIYENGSSILSGTNSFIKSLKLNVTNNVNPRKALGVFGSMSSRLGELAITGTMEIYVEDANYYTKWFKGTATNLALGMSDKAGNGYFVEMDKVQFKDGGINSSEKNGDVMLSLPFQAFYSPTTGRGIRMTRAAAT
jgi:hypothetical protein